MVHIVRVSVVPSRKRETVSGIYGVEVYVPICPNFSIGGRIGVGYPIVVRDIHGMAASSVNSLADIPHVRSVAITEYPLGILCGILKITVVGHMCDGSRDIKIRTVMPRAEPSISTVGAYSPLIGFICI